MTFYRIQDINGKFDHVAGKSTALDRARQMAGAPAITTEAELSEHWGVSITPVSTSDALSVELMTTAKKAGA